MGPISDRLPMTEKDYNVLKKVSLEQNYPLKDLMTVYALESDSGFQEGTKDSTFKGPFQFNDATALEFKLDDVWDLKKSAEAHIRLVNKRTKSVKNILQNNNVSSDLLDSLDSSTFNYLLHNQGAWGTARLEIGAKKGVYKGRARENMLSNLTTEQQEYFKDPKVGISEATKYFLKSIDANLRSTRSTLRTQHQRFEMPPMKRAVFDSAAVDTFLTKEPQ
tara:strand:- start:37 stop:696 length:660 start_codon:yes stop_codon:yes gene_type:complete